MRMFGVVANEVFFARHNHGLSNTMVDLNICFFSVILMYDMKLFLQQKYMYVLGQRALHVSSVTHAGR